jgi:predicted nucleic acid-binding protein
MPLRPTPLWLTALTTALLLDRGESEGLLLMGEAPHAFFFTDDSAARLAAQQLGYRVHGTIGILLRSIRRGQRTAAEVVTLLENLPSRSSLYLRPSLLRETIAETRARYHLE